MEEDKADRNHESNVEAHLREAPSQPTSVDEVLIVPLDPLLLANFSNSTPGSSQSVVFHLKVYPQAQNRVDHPAVLADDAAAGQIPLVSKPSVDPQLQLNYSEEQGTTDSEPKYTVSRRMQAEFALKTDGLFVDVLQSNTVQAL